MHIKRLLMMALGFLFTALAFVGVVLPILPTTPFLLLAVFFFAHSSERWHHYLLNHRIFGSYLTDYYNHRMTISNKCRTLALLWIGMGICMWLLRSRTWILFLLFTIAVGVTIHLARFRSVQPAAAHAAASSDTQAPAVNADPVTTNTQAAAGGTF